MPPLMHTHSHTHTHAHTRTHTCTHTGWLTYPQTYAHTCTYVHARARARTYARMHARTLARTHARTHACPRTHPHHTRTAPRELALVLLPRRLRAAHARSTAAAGHGEHAWATPSALSLPALCPAIVRVLLSSVSPCRTTHTRSVMHAACCLLPLQLEAAAGWRVHNARTGRRGRGEGSSAVGSAPDSLIGGRARRGAWAQRAVRPGQGAAG